MCAFSVITEVIYNILIHPDSFVEWKHLGKSKLCGIISKCFSSIFKTKSDSFLIILNWGVSLNSLSVTEMTNNTFSRRI